MDTTKFQKDLDRLILKGKILLNTMISEIDPKQKKLVLEAMKIRSLPAFSSKYQAWYSESLALVSQLLPARKDDFIPARKDDFIAYYKPRAVRKSITYDNYTIEDYLQGLTVTRGGYEVVVDKKAAYPKFEQQRFILESLSNRFKSSLYDLSTIVQADLFDSELDAAQGLQKQGHVRAAGAVAGVVLESHLKTVCEQHSLKISKKNPTLADYNDALKEDAIIETPTWRNIQFLGDIRNLCDHKKEKEPTPEQVQDLIDGVRKVTKTVF